MSIKTTVWKAEPHTIAKHRILTRYLDAWLPILTSAAAFVPGSQTIYIDGFAGPGVYERGEDGSPILAAKQALKHNKRPFRSAVRMAFIESDRDRAEMLVKQLEPVRAQLGSAKDIVLEQPIVEECAKQMNEWLDRLQLQSKKLGPALAFFDQFGYSDVPMELIARILGCERCEVFVYIEFKNVNRFITDATKEPGFTVAFGGDEWKECIPLPSREARLQRLRELYVAALRNRAKCKYVQHFTMYDDRRNPLYWLFFCTNHILGLQEMKRAMWDVDKTGEFKFSDADQRDQGRLLDSYSQDWLADTMAKELAGKEMSIADLREWALTGTPCYLFKQAAVALERKSRAEVFGRTQGTRAGTFPDEQLQSIRIRFPGDLFGSEI